MMKKVLFVVMAAAMLFSCHKEETNDCGCDVETGIPTKIYINGETGCESVKVRSTDGRINFEGGYATGAGVYDGDKRPTVEAHPNEGYEVDYFYGGPAGNEKKYDYSTAGKTSFEVKLENQDHFFKCKFKKVEKKYKLTVTSHWNGTATGSGMYPAETPIKVTATPKKGYEFFKWSVQSAESSISIEDPTQAETTVILHSSNASIFADYRSIEPLFYIELCDEQFDPRGVLNAAIIEDAFGEEVTTKKVGYSGDVTYSIHDEEGIYEIKTFGKRKFMGWYDKNEELITTDINLYSEDILRGYDLGTTIYARIDFNGEGYYQPPTIRPSKIDVKIKHLGEYFTIPNRTSGYESYWPAADYYDGDYVKLESSTSNCGTLKIYTAPFESSPYCKISESKSKYVTKTTRSDNYGDSGYVKYSRWEWNIHGYTFRGECNTYKDLRDVKGTFIKDGVTYTISY